jgi:hypothetical protein
MSTLSFADFLRSGRLGPITIGASQNEIVSEFGEPMDVLLQKNPQILRYGPIEFGLMREKGTTSAHLKSIAFRFSCAESLPGRIQFRDHIPSCGDTEEVVRAHLADIGESVFASAGAEDRRYLVTDSGVRMSFVGGRLHSAHFAGKEPAERPAQVSVSLPPNEIQPIRNEAQKRGKSVSQLTAGYVRALQSEAGKMAIKPQISSELEDDPAAFVNIWKITKIMNDEAGLSAGLVTAKWRVMHDAGRHLYVLTVIDPWGSAEASFTPTDIATPESTRDRLQRLWGDLLQRSVNS